MKLPCLALEVGVSVVKNTEVCALIYKNHMSLVIQNICNIKYVEFFKCVLSTQQGLETSLKSPD